jgi:hypothetical protein
MPFERLNHVLALFNRRRGTLPGLKRRICGRKRPAVRNFLRAGWHT